MAKFHQQPRSLEGRIAIVTGASSGIGKAVAELFARSGAKTVINARREDRLQTLRSDLVETGAGIAVVSGDATERSTVARLFDECRKNFNAEADLVVVNAGKGLKGSLLNSDPDGWADLLTLNVQSALYLMREAALRMIEDVNKNGRFSRPRDIVVLGSCVGKNVLARSSIYSATKFAVHSAAEALRREICSHGIRVSLIEPGIVETEFHDVARYGDNFYQESSDSIGPLLKAGDIAELIGFVTSLPAHVHLHEAGIRPVRQEYP